MSGSNSKATPPKSESNGEQKPSAEAARRAAAILEVLGGQRTTTEAADALEISLNHYYLLEKKALGGLTAACELKPKGPKGPGLEAQLKALQHELEQCQRECLRQTALVRATQRAVGLSAVPTPQQAKRGGKSAKSPARKTRKRRPQIRALRAAEAAKKNCSGKKSEMELSQTLPAEKGMESTGPPSTVKEPSDGA
jgi:hypothetical protein